MSKNSLINLATFILLNFGLVTKTYGQAETFPSTKEVFDVSKKPDKIKAGIEMGPRVFFLSGAALLVGVFRSYQLSPRWYFKTSLTYCYLSSSVEIPSANVYPFYSNVLQVPLSFHLILLKFTKTFDVSLDMRFIPELYFGKQHAHTEIRHEEKDESMQIIKKFNPSKTLLGGMLNGGWGLSITLYAFSLSCVVQSTSGSGSPNGSGEVTLGYNLWPYFSKKSS